MIVTRTNSDWAAKSALYLQKLKVNDVTYTIEIFSICNKRNLIVIHRYVNGDCKIFRYTYYYLMGIIAPIRQVFRTDFGIELDWLNKFIVDDGCSGIGD